MSRCHMFEDGGIRTLHISKGSLDQSVYLFLVRLGRPLFGGAERFHYANNGQGEQQDAAASKSAPI